MKKTLSGLMALLLLLTVSAGCGNNDAASDGPISSKGIYYDLTGIDSQETMLEYGGNTAPAELYFYWLGYSCSDVEYRINMYNAYYDNVYGDLVDENGKIIWDGALDDTTPSQAAKDGADSNVLSYLVLENMAKEYGVTLTEEDKANMESTLAQQIEQSGGEEAFQESLSQMGISRETFDRISSAGYLLDHLEELAADPSSSLYEAPSEENNAYVDHILLATKDTSTGEALGEEEAAAKRAQAEDLLAQLQTAVDLPAKFDELMMAHSEDNPQNNPDGYLSKPGDMVAAFESASLALEEGGLSGIVETEYGYHIILRLPLTDEDRAQCESQYRPGVLEDLMDQWSESADVVRSEALNGLDVAGFCNRLAAYQAAMSEKLGPAESAPVESGGVG